MPRQGVLHIEPRAPLLDWLKNAQLCILARLFHARFSRFKVDEQNANSRVRELGLPQGNGRL
jgi:hypothetical protein